MKTYYLYRCLDLEECKG